MSLLITQGFGTFGPGTFSYLPTTMGLGGPGIEIDTGFSLSSVVPIALATIRVSFTEAPLLVSPAGVHDGLNPANYSLLGPGLVFILSVAPVFGNPNAVDLSLSNPLTSGVWTLFANILLEAFNTALISPPLNQSFLISATAIGQEAVNKGAENSTQCDVVRGFLNPALQGDAWQALCCAVGVGDATNVENARLAFDQLFTSTASGIYLTRHASDSDIQRPKNIGISDELFRQYTVKMTNGKVTENSLLDILSVFYGMDSVRAHQDSSVIEPFSFNNEDNLITKIDNLTIVNTIFTLDDFAVIGMAKAIEVAAALTRSFSSNNTDAFALATIDPQDGSTKVRIYSGSLGLGSSVEILGGSAQNTLKFPTQVHTKVAGQPTWNITFDPATTTVRFSPSSPEFDMSQVHIGDYANIYGNIFNPGNRGTFTINNVYWAYPDQIHVTQYFEITNPLGSNQAGLLQVHDSDLLVFRPTISTTHSTPERAVVVSSIGEEVDIILPATSQAVNRGKYRAAYVQANPSIALSSLTRVKDTVTVVTGLPSGLSVGSQVEIDGTYTLAAIPPIVPGVQIINSGTSDSSIGTIISSLAPSVQTGKVRHSVIKLSDGRALITGGDTLIANVRTISNSSETFRVDSIVEQPDTRLVVSYDSLAISGTMPTARANAAISLGAGSLINKAVLTGGDTGAAATNTTYEFNQAAAAGAGVWSVLAPMGTVRTAHGQTTLANSTILVDGGVGAVFDSVQTSSEIYTPSTNTWAPTGSMVMARCDHQQVLLKDGNVLAVGGRDPNGGGGHLYYADVTDMGNVFSTCEIFGGGFWSATGPMAFARFNHTLIIIPDGRVLVFGGMGYNPTQIFGNPAPITAIECYDPVTQRWRVVGQTSIARDNIMAEYIPEKNYIVIMGGNTNVIEVFDIKTFKIKNIATTLPVREMAKSVLLDSGLVLVTGGANGMGTTTNADYLFIPNSDDFSGESFNDQFRVDSIISPTSFTFKTTNESKYNLNGSVIGTVTPVAATPSKIPGPFIFDPNAGLAVTDDMTTSSMSMAKGHKYASISVADATQIPDQEGWLVFAFGYKNQVGPVKCFGRLSNTSLSIDFNFVFTENINVGDSVTHLFNKGSFVPAHPEQVGSFYLTASPAGRVAASNAIDQAVAAGVNVNKTIVYPGDRGIGAEGYPTHGNYKLSDIVGVFSSDQEDAEIAAARED